MRSRSAETSVEACPLRRPTHGPLTPPAWSAFWRAIAPCPRRHRCGSPSAPRTCSGPARRRTRPGLDTSGLTDVIAVDPEARTADVAGMCTYEDLVAATLPFGLAPLVVPQLKTITLGGAVTGLGIESTSFRNGLPHESVLEMDILTGAGEVVTASPHENADLYRAFPNSYGTLGYAVRLRIELEPVQPFVALTHVRFHTLAELVAAMDRIIADRSTSTASRSTTSTASCSAPTRATCASARRPRHPDPSATTPASRSTTGPSSTTTASRPTGSRSTTISGGGTPTGSGAPGRSGRSIRSSAGSGRGATCAAAPTGSSCGSSGGYDIGDRLEKLHGRPPRERVIQDVEVPIERCAEFLDWFLANVPIEPIWLCPLRLRDDDGWPLYPIEPNRDLRQRRLLVDGAGRCRPKARRTG